MISVIIIKHCSLIMFAALCQQLSHNHKEREASKKGYKTRQKLNPFWKKKPKGEPNSTTPLSGSVEDSLKDTSSLSSVTPVDSNPRMEKTFDSCTGQPTIVVIDNLDIFKRSPKLVYI